MMSLPTPPDRPRFDSARRPTPVRVAVRAAGLSLLAAGLLAAGPAAAQVMIGANRTQVYVNPEVLDDLGPPPTVGRLLGSGQPTQLRPPGSNTRVPTGIGGAAAPAGDVPRSRIYALPGSAPAPIAAPSAPSSQLYASTGSSYTPPASSYTPPAPSYTPPASTYTPPAPAASSYTPSVPAPAPTYAAPAAAAPAPSYAPPPSPPERRTPAATVNPAPPPPAPDLSEPPPTAPVRTAARPVPPPAAPVPAAPVAPPPAPPVAAPAAPLAPTPSVSGVPPMPPPAPAPARVEAAATQVASAGAALSRVVFPSGSADLTDASRRELTQLADRIGRDSDSRVQLLAYAEGTPDSESQARRLSLSRALAVRSFLIEQGIRSTRVNVQALGIKSAGGPADRVDATLVTP